MKTLTSHHTIKNYFLKVLFYFKKIEHEITKSALFAYVDLSTGKKIF